MSWYLTIRFDSDYSRAIDARGLVAFLRSLPELTQAGDNAFQAAPGQPWVNVTLAMGDRGSYAVPGQPLASVNLVDVVCSDGHDASWYDALAGRIAAFLGWEALVEHAGRVVWPRGGAG
jgi:hypothetical protein